MASALVDRALGAIIGSAVADAAGEGPRYYWPILLNQSLARLFNHKH